MLINLIVVIFSQCLCTSDDHVVQLKKTNKQLVQHGDEEQRRWSHSPWVEMTTPPFLEVFLCKTYLGALGASVFICKHVQQYQCLPQSVVVRINWLIHGEPLEVSSKYSIGVSTALLSL